jgi:hypothetical protein
MELQSERIQMGRNGTCANGKRQQHNLINGDGFESRAYE